MTISTKLGTQNSEVLEEAVAQIETLMIEEETGWKTVCTANTTLIDRIGTTSTGAAGKIYGTLTEKGLWFKLGTILV